MAVTIEANFSFRLSPAIAINQAQLYEQARTQATQLQQAFQDLQEQIFNPFFTTKPVGQGTGLGLAISQRIILEKHRGNLLCESIPGQMTKFEIELPITQ